jgi:hypothetical protein
LERFVHIDPSDLSSMTDSPSSLIVICGRKVSRNSLVAML